MSAFKFWLCVSPAANSRVCTCRVYRGKVACRLRAWANYRGTEWDAQNAVRNLRPICREQRP